MIANNGNNNGHMSKTIPMCAVNAVNDQSHFDSNIIYSFKI